MTDRRRRHWLGLLGLASVGTLVVGATLTDGGGSGRGDPASHQAIDKASTTSGDGDVPYEGSEGLGADTDGEIGQHVETQTTGPSTGQSLTGSGDGLAVGVLEEGVLLEAPFGYFDAQAGRDQTEFKARRASPFVGGVVATASHGRDLILVATNHAEIIRLKSDWETVDTLLPFEIPEGEDYPLIGYGSLLVDGDRLLASYRMGGKVAISEIDLRAWRVIKQQVIPSRFAGFPQACFIDDGLLALVTTEGVSIVDATTLAERHFTRLEGAPVGLVCAEGEAWVSDSSAPRGWIIREDGSSAGTFAWNGNGSNALAYSPTDGRVFGTDSVGSRVFACEAASRACLVGGDVGRKPTSLLVHGDRVYVTLELDTAVALIDKQTLEPVGRVLVPGAPRTLTVVPLP